MDQQERDNEDDPIISNEGSSEHYTVGITYNEAVEKTINHDPKSPPLSWIRKVFTKVGGSIGIFQLIYISVFLISVNTYDPELFGLGLLEKEPRRFECYHDPEEGQSEGEWRECTKEEICDGGIPHDHYRPVTDDDEYIDNWVSPEKFDLLCESKFKVGLLGSCFFAGAVATLLVFPPLSDAYGRKYMYLIVLGLSIIAQWGLLVTTNLYEAYVYQFINGTTLAGKICIGLNYCIEFNVASCQKAVVLAFLLSEAIGLVLITAWYQFVDRHWYTLQLILLIVIILVTIYYALVVPESPKWLYTWNYYEESRENLKYVAEVNAVSEGRARRIQRLKFDKELAEEKEKAALERLEQMDNEPSEQSRASSFRESLMSRRQYVWNVIKMTIFWTTCSFSFYMLQSATKYYEGSLYLNYYLDSVAGIMGAFFAQPLYDVMHFRNASFLSFGITIFFGIILLGYQEYWLSPNWVEAFGVQPSGYPEGSKADREYHLGYLIPAIVFAVKIGVNFSFLNAYQASFNENIIFPFFKRATAIGVCNFIARTATIFAPLAAELPCPWPTTLLLILNTLALIVTFTLPTKEEEQEFEKHLDLFLKGLEDKKGKSHRSEGSGDGDNGPSQNDDDEKDKME